ncbi:MAG: 4-hydroxy-2-oxoheptanedioate aldolase [Solirubrobacteraceae bacterium]|jgi:4-hydroxy-2-oxoheptanedioate aldolase|nr:4-hydroxy-2-oxoheptanedioate aldolase [Solirubrobacteraceae bacterium]
MSTVLPDRPTLGGWCHIPGGFAAEVVAAAGFDWVLVDRQHGLISEDDLFDMLRALQISATPSFVRVSQTDHAEIGRALDAGAHGVVVPQVGSVEEARAAAAACRYGPTGRRSIGPSRLKLYGRADPEAANASVLCLPMIESQAGLDAVEAIADVEGVDGLFVGPADLGLDTGLQGAAFDDALRRIAAACSDRGKLAGAFGMGAARIPGWIELGYSFLAVDSDATFLLDGARAAVSAARRGLPPAATR